MKGVLMAGGKGTRLFPITSGLNKHLLPVFDKPMIYYPLSVFMLAGIRQTMLICNQQDYEAYQRTLGNGERFGLHLVYAIQKHPRGIGEAFSIARDFIANDTVCLLLGDNIFVSNQLTSILQKCVDLKRGGILFAYRVSDPERYGVIEFDKKHHVTNIVEKPKHPKTNFAVPGIYFYDNRVCKIATTMSPSDRGELEITDINDFYLHEGDLTVKEFGRGSVWFDTGTTASLYNAAEYIETVESRQGLKIGCLEEIAFRKGYISKEKLINIISRYPESEYKYYLESIVSEGE